jgi:trehalose utilization protein
MSQTIRVTVWNEGVHEKKNEAVRKVYPEGMGHQIGQYLEKQPGIASVHVSELGDPDQGLSDAILNDTDVMTWWGHLAHNELTDENAARVQKRVLEGMGLIVLHSGHLSKPFTRLMGTSCMLKWREWKNVGERERLWVLDPAHPIVDGIPERIEIDHEEMYGEHFDIPKPDELVFVSWFQGGEVFRSGACWHRGQGKVFYFRPGHETFPTYHNKQVLQVIANAVRWAAPSRVLGGLQRDHFEPPIEAID